MAISTLVMLVPRAATMAIARSMDGIARRISMILMIILSAVLP